MIVERTSLLEAPAELVWEALLRTDTFSHVARPLLRFPPAELAQARWLPGMELEGRLLLLGFIPLGRHRIHIESVDEEARCLQTREGSRLLKRWDHEIRVSVVDEHTCRYRDRLDIEAGAVTAVVGLFVGLLFRYRHHRWRHLARELTAG